MSYRESVNILNNAIVISEKYYGLNKFLYKNIVIVKNGLEIFDSENEDINNVDILIRLFTEIKSVIEYINSENENKCSIDYKNRTDNAEFILQNYLELSSNSDLLINYTQKIIESYYVTRVIYSIK